MFGVFDGVERMDGVFLLTITGVCDLLERILSGLGVKIESFLVDARRFAAGDIEANRSNVDRIRGDAMFLRAVSIAFAFWSRIRSLTLSANCKAIVSRFDVSAIRKDGPPDGLLGVSPPSNRNGVPSSSPHVINGLSAMPGCGDGVFTKLNPRMFGVAKELTIFPSTSILPLELSACDFARSWIVFLSL